MAHSKPEVSELYECPVCLEVPNARILQCTHGHLLCQGCFIKLSDKRCPTCRITLSTRRPIRSLVAEAAISKLPATCKGCKLECTRGVLRDHVCGHRAFCKDTDKVCHVVYKGGETTMIEHDDHIVYLNGDGRRTHAWYANQEAVDQRMLRAYKCKRDNVPSLQGLAMHALTIGLDEHKVDPGTIVGTLSSNMLKYVVRSIQWRRLQTAVGGKRPRSMLGE